ncbi:MAG: S8 family serine peptidase [Bacteroidia bacterium]|nr:S8 family serine peptidase [Bacteroidia bacterium]
MKFFKLMLSGIILLIPSFLQGQAGIISPSLYQKVMADPEIQVHVGAMLSDRLDINDIYFKWKKLKPSLQERNSYLINQLKSKAAKSQKQILGDLNGSSSVECIHPYWLANVIFFKIKGRELIELGLHPDLAYIFEVGFISNDHMSYGEEDALALPSGRESGLAVIGAPYLWRLGYTGYGTKVLNIDSGIYPEHPAYSQRYLGKELDKSLAWFDPAYRFTEPEYCNWHGSHTLGTILGLDPQTQDTIGVAFEAQWMGANATCPGRTTEDIIATFQWAMDPDGDSTTREDVPDVINNSWTDQTFSDECQNTLYSDVFTALEANGVALVFSAGNTGPSGSSIPPPKNINIDEVNTFTVGVINGNSSLLNLISFSSRGPSDCPGGGALAIKPEVVAPGFQVRSAHTDGSYRSRSGTSMAAPHVSGSLLLLKQAFPDLPGYELKQALYQSARDLGVQGEDNDYGNGLIAVDSAFRLLLLQGNIAINPENGVDIAVKEVLGIQQIVCENQLTPILELENIGRTIIDELTIRYELDGLTRTTSWIGNLFPGNSLSLPLPSYDLDQGKHLFSVSVGINSTQLEYRILNNRKSYAFFSYPPDLPLIKNYDVCEGSDAALFASAEGEGEVRWFSEDQRLMGTGERLWYGPAREPDQLEVAIYSEKTIGPAFPPNTLESFDKDSSYFLQFDVERNFLLRGFEIFADGSAQLQFFLKDKRNVIRYQRTQIVQAGKQFIDLDWMLTPGEDYLLMVKSPVPLLRQVEGIQYPFSEAGILRMNGSFGGRNSYNYFYNWAVEFELPCSRKPYPLRILKGNMKANFEVFEDRAYFYSQDSISFLDKSDPAKSWYWDFGDGISSELSNPKHLYSDSGQYEIFLVSVGRSDCSDAHRDSLVFFPSQPDNNSPEIEDLWELFPNPSRGKIVLKNDNYPFPFIDLSVYTILGELKKKQRIYVQGGSFLMDISDYSQGLYLLQLETQHNTYFRKIQLER